MLLRNLIYKGVGSMIALLCVCVELRGEYAPPVNVEDYPQAKVREGQRALRALPQLARDAFIAERLGLIFLDSGKPAYENDVKGGTVKFRPVIHGGKFVTSSGKVVDFYKERDNAFGKGKTRVANGMNWKNAGEAIGEVGDEVIFSGISRDVTRVVKQRAKYNLKLLPRKLREAFLAEWGNLLYMKSGESAYGAIKYERSIWPTQELKQKQEWREVKPEAMFIDTTGKELSFSEVHKEFASGKYGYAYWLSQWCVNLVGAKDILGMFPKELEALRAAYQEKRSDKTKKQTGKDRDSESETEPKESASNADRTTENAPNAEEQQKLEAQRAGCKNLVNMLRNRPLQQRQSLFAWFLGLRYGFNNQFFLASNGNQYSFWDEIWHMGGWQYMRRLTDLAGGIYPVIAEFTQEVAEMRRHYYERDVKLVSHSADGAVSVLHELKPEERAAWFAAMTGLLYTPDGNAGMEWSDDTSSFKVKEDAHFMTTDGKEMSFFETQKAADAALWNKARDAVKIQGVLDSVLQVFAKEYKDIRKAVEAKLVPIEDKEVDFVRKTLKTMPAELCSAWLALTGELLYTPDGCGDWYHREDGRRIPFGDALFMDTEGTEMCYSKTVNEKIKGFENQWNYLLRLVERPHMQEAIRSKYAKELNCIRAAAEKRKRELIRNFDAGY